MSVKIFIGGFPLDSSELELVQLVGPYAEVETIKIVRDKISKKCKGYAFIELTDEQGADRVIDALDGTLLAGKPLTINKVADEPLKAAPTPFKPKRPRISK